jgi:hypothetical protein
MSKQKGIYLVARYYMKPQDRVNTSKAGWMNDPNNIRWDESMVVTRGLKPKDNSAQVILNLSEKTVIRNTFGTQKTFDEVFRYFFNGYSNYLIPVMGQLDPGYLDQLAETIKAEMANDEQPLDVKYEEIQAQ